MVYTVLAELGVIFLLFLTGLETRASDIFRVGGRAAAVAVLGVTFPFLLGYLFISLLGRPTVEAVFVATAMVATSVGITAPGEVGFIVASIGTSIGVIPQDMFSVVIIMSIVTTIIVPPVLKLLYRERSTAGEAGPGKDLGDNGGEALASST